MNGDKGKKECKIKKFNLETSVAGGCLRVGLKGNIDFSNITLSGSNKEDYLIHVEYSSEEKKYRFSAYRKKE